MTDPSLRRFRLVLEGAVTHLESRRQEINDLNVFPVADGDTGDNMALTLQACLDEVRRLEQDEDGSLDEIGRNEIARSVQRAALLGARGNSGVILSQLIRGATEFLLDPRFSRVYIDPRMMGQALSAAAARAEASVSNPAPGTILTVMSAMAQAALAHRPAQEPLRLCDDDVERQNRLLADTLEHAIAEGERTLRDSRDQLPALREAGVVDAGGYGAIVLLAGVVAVLRGEAAPEVAHQAPAARPTHHEHESSRYRFCTNFAVIGSPLDPIVAKPLLEALPGDSVLVVGDRQTLRVHVHTNDPDLAFGVFDGGEIAQPEVSDMHEQIAARAGRLADRQVSALVVVVPDAVLAAEVEREFGATAVIGGVSLNPSTGDLLEAVRAAPSDDVVLLPSSPNVLMAAEKAAGLADERVTVLPTRTVQASFELAWSFTAGRAAQENADEMRGKLQAVRTGGVARAAKDDVRGRFVVGEAVGFVDETIVAWGEPGPTLRVVLDRVVDGQETVTLITSADAPVPDVEALVPDGLDVSSYATDAAAWWWQLAASPAA